MCISTNWPEMVGEQSFSDGLDGQRMSTRAVAITSALLISPIVWKKEMSTVSPNRVQFSATEIGLFCGIDYTQTKRDKKQNQRKVLQNHCILNNFLFLVTYRTQKDPLTINYALHQFLLCKFVTTAKNILLHILYFIDRCNIVLWF